MSSLQVNNATYKTSINIGAGKIKQVCWYFTNACFLKNSAFPFSSLKVALLKAFGASIGKGVVIKPCVNVKYPWKLSIGDHTWIGENVWIDNLAFTTIGNNVCISQGALLLTGNHNYKKSSFDLVLAEIIIENGAWIGAKSIVCPGTFCATHFVIAAGSTLSGKTEPYGIYKGNPAQKSGTRIIES